MNALEIKLNYTFKNKNLLLAALTHSSYANEHKRQGSIDNERLEFLGDSILGMITAEYIYTHFPEMPEGSMSRLRAELVCEKNLALVAKKLCIPELLLLGKGGETNGDRMRPSVTSDAVEAVLAAVYLDGGMEPVKEIIYRFILTDVFVVSENDDDYKSQLQEYLQKGGACTIEYRIIKETGPDHDKSFEAEVLADGKSLGTGIGRKKQKAEQAAAKAALEFLNK